MLGKTVVGAHGGLLDSHMDQSTYRQTTPPAGVLPLLPISIAETTVTISCFSVNTMSQFAMWLVS